MHSLNLLVLRCGMLLLVCTCALHASVAGEIAESAGELLARSAITNTDELAPLLVKAERLAGPVGRQAVLAAGPDAVQVLARASAAEAPGWARLLAAHPQAIGWTDDCLRLGVRVGAEPAGRLLRLGSDCVADAASTGRELPWLRVAQRLETDGASEASRRSVVAAVRREPGLLHHLATNAHKVGFGGLLVAVGIGVATNPEATLGAAGDAAGTVLGAVGSAVIAPLAPWIGMALVLIALALCWRIARAGNASPQTQGQLLRAAGWGAGALALGLCCIAMPGWAGIALLVLASAATCWWVATRLRRHRAAQAASVSLLVALGGVASAVAAPEQQAPPQQSVRIDAWSLLCLAHADERSLVTELATWLAQTPPADAQRVAQAAAGSPINSVAGLWQDGSEPGWRDVVHVNAELRGRHQRAWALLADRCATANTGLALALGPAADSLLDLPLAVPAMSELRSDHALIDHLGCSANARLLGNIAAVPGQVPFIYDLLIGVLIDEGTARAASASTARALRAASADVIQQQSLQFTRQTRAALETLHLQRMQCVAAAAGYTTDAMAAR